MMSLSRTLEGEQTMMCEIHHARAKQRKASRRDVKPLAGGQMAGWAGLWLGLRPLRRYCDTASSLLWSACLRIRVAERAMRRGKP